MVASKQNHKMIALFEELRRACECDDFDIEDTDVVDTVVTKIRSEGVDVSAREESSSVEFDKDEPVTYFKRNVALYFGEVRVYQWSEEYWGYYGDMGTGWWKELHEGGLNEGLEYGLEELCDIPEADVPEPSEP